MEQKKGTLLIVEDNISVLKSLKLYLKSKFENVITLSNPNQINQILDSENIDVILLDMNFLAGIFTGNEGIFWMRKILKTDPDAVIPSGNWLKSRFLVHLKPAGKSYFSFP
ncbi:MAG: response regulator [Bacteroidales bacterium]|nr:response regulator [Bacteroidales bacterium]